MAAPPSLPQLAREYPAGTVLFRESEPGDTMYVIQRGQVKIFRTVGQTEIVLALLGPGEFFGEMALLEGLPRSASAEVLADAALVEVAQDTFEDVVRRNSEIALRMMRKLSARVRDADRRIQSLMLDSGLGRLIEVLHALHLHAQPDERGARLAPDITCTLPQRTGVPLAALEPLMERLAEAGVIERQPDGALLLRAAEDLDAFAEYLQLKQGYDPLTVLELSEISGLSEREVRTVMLRVLERYARAEPTQEPSATALQRFLTLKRRFEYQPGTPQE